MIIDMDEDLSIVPEGFQRAKTIGLMGVHENQPSDLCHVEVFEPGDADIMDGEEAPDRLLRSGGQDQTGAGIEFATRHHGR